VSASNDDALWHAQLAGVIPLKGRLKGPLKEKRRLARAVAPLRSVASDTDERTIDLHGLALAEAHRVVAREIVRAATAGFRRLRIITGKGRAHGRATIRGEIRDWLDAPEMKRLIVAVRAAPRERGGDGAVDVQLRRRASDIKAPRPARRG